MRNAASWGHPRQLISLPLGARTGLGPLIETSSAIIVARLARGCCNQCVGRYRHSGGTLPTSQRTPLGRNNVYGNDMSAIDPGTAVRAGDADFAEVLDRARQGSGRALRRLYDSLNQQVAGYLRVRGANDVDVATNEVFHRAFDRLDHFKGNETGFRSWVFVIAHNLLIDDHRKRIRRPNVVASLDTARHEVVGGDVEAEAIANLAAGDIDQILEGLTPNQRDVMHLRLVGGLTLAETAEVLERPLGAVKSLQHRAVEALRKNLEELRVSPDAIGTFSEMT